MRPVTKPGRSVCEPSPPRADCIRRLFIGIQWYRAGVRTGLAIAIAITWVITGVDASTALAQGRGAQSPKPWAEGVSETNQRRALQLFEAGNRLLEDKKYNEALERYEQALKSWDHPSIRYNMAICFMNMRQPLVAWEHLEKALRFGAAPLGKQLYTDAMTHRATLEASLAELTVKATQPDVKVVVDGDQGVESGRARVMRMLAGRHQLVATGEDPQHRS